MLERDALIATVTKAQAGDRLAMNELFCHYLQSIRYFILKQVKQEDLADDITQDTVEQILLHIGSLSEPAAFVKWAKTIAYSQCTRHFRKKKDVLVDEDEEGATLFDSIMEEAPEFIPDQALEKSEAFGILLRHMDALPPHLYEAIKLFYFDEFSIKEIAEMRGIPINTVKSHLYKGRMALERSLSKYEEETGTQLFHSIGLLPLLLFFFRKDAVAHPMASERVEAIRQRLGLSEASSAPSVPEGAGAPPAPASAGAGAGGAMAAATSVAAAPLATKVTLGILGGIVALALVFFGTKAILQNGSDGDPTVTEEVTETDPTEEETEPDGVLGGDVTAPLDTEGGDLTDPLDTEADETVSETEPAGEKYESELLVVYGDSHRFKNNLSGIVGEWSPAIQTLDGKIYGWPYESEDDTKGSPVADTDVAIYLTGYYGFRDKDGVLHFGGGICSDFIGEPIWTFISVNDTQALVSFDGGRLYLNEYDEDGNKLQYDNAPLYVADNTTTGVYYENFRRVTVRTVNGKAYCLAEAEEGPVFYGEASTIFNFDEKSSLRLGPLAADAAILFDFGYTYSRTSPLYAESDTATRLTFTDGWNDTRYHIALPDGYTAADVKRALFGDLTVVIFEDNTVWACTISLTDAGATMTQSEELTALMQQGAIRDLRLTAGDRYTDCNLVVLCDDNVLYEIDDSHLVG